MFGSQPHIRMRLLTRARRSDGTDSTRRPPAKHHRSHAQSLVELALVTPILVLCLVITADFARVYSDSIELSNMAREGAHYGSLSSTNAADTAGIQAAALDEGNAIDGSEPTVTSSTGTDGYSQGSESFDYVRVTVSFDFHPLFPFPPVPDTITLHRTAEMRVMGE